MWKRLLWRAERFVAPRGARIPSTRISYPFSALNPSALSGKSNVATPNRNDHGYCPGCYDERYWYRFTRSSILIPAVLVLAVPINHEETDLDGSEFVQPYDASILELLRKGKKMLETKCSFESVEDVYKEALHLALNKKDKSATAYVQDQLANLFLRQGKLKEAEELFRNVIRNLLDTGMEESNVAVIEISLKLATIYASSKNHELAVTGYEWVVEKCRENLTKNENAPKNKRSESACKNQVALLGMALDSYGRYLYMNRNYERALDVTREAYELAKQLFGESDVRTLVILNDLGAILNAVGEFDEAEKTIEKAVLDATGSEDVDHADIAVFWVNLSSIYKKHGKMDKMSKAFENARREAKLSKDRSLQRHIEQNIEQITEL